MRHRFAIATLCASAWLSATGQQGMQAVPPDGAVRTAPVLLPSTATISKPAQCDALSGIVKFAATIDPLGSLHPEKTLEASDWRLVNFATELIEAQRFKPGTVDGLPAAVSVELTIGLHTCAQRKKHPTNDDFYQFTLWAHPVIALAVVPAPTAQEAVSTPPAEAVPAEEVGGQISAPIPVVLTDPKVPISGKMKRGRCFLGVTVDANGVPQNIHVLRGLEPELDSYALEAVKSWRFKPALRDGKTPVAVEGTVVAAFESMENEPVAFADFFAEAPEKVLAANAHDWKQGPTLEPVNADEVITRYMPQSHIAGRVFVSLIVDTNGVPQNVHVIKGLDSGVDMDTVAMIEHMRFKPVMKDATTPVPVGIVIPVRYRVAAEKPEWQGRFNSGLALIMLALI